MDRFDVIFIDTNLVLENLLVQIVLEPPNGWRYPLVGGTMQRYFNGSDFKPRKPPENAQTPTSRVQAVLGCVSEGSCAEELNLIIGRIDKVFLSIVQLL